MKMLRWLSIIGLLPLLAGCPCRPDVNGAKENFLKEKETYEEIIQYINNTYFEDLKQRKDGVYFFADSIEMTQAFYGRTTRHYDRFVADKLKSVGQNRFLISHDDRINDSVDAIIYEFGADYGCHWIPMSYRYTAFKNVFPEEDETTRYHEYHRLDSNWVIYINLNAL